MKSLTKLSASVMVAMLLTACGGLKPKPFTEDQLSKLTPISVNKTMTSPKAFYDISIKSYQMPRYTTGLPERRGFIAMAIDISDAVQQGKFSDRYGALLTQIKDKSQENFDDKIAAQLKNDLNSIPFFNGKIKEGAQTKIEITVKDYGFVRAGSDKGSTSAVDNLPLAYGAFGNVNIVDSAGKIIFSDFLRAQSKTTGDVPTLVANDFELVKKMQEEVVTSLSAQVKSGLEAKFTAK